MKKKIALAIITVVLAAYVIAPDPFPVVIDDVAAGLGSAGTLLALISAFLKKKQQ